jgi:ankyrin repeat protein
MKLGILGAVTRQGYLAALYTSCSTPARDVGPSYQTYKYPHLSQSLLRIDKHNHRFVSYPPNFNMPRKKGKGMKGGNNPPGDDDGLTGFSSRAPSIDEQLLEATKKHSPNVNEVQRLLNAGAKVNAVGLGGRSALHEAVYHGDERLVELLLERHANVNAESLTGTTPLHEITKIYPPSQAAPIARLLKRFGADVSLKDEDGFTPLFQAAESGRADLIPVFAELQADLNAKDAQGWPLITYAASRGRVGVVEELLKLHVNPKVRGGRYGNALQAAAVHGRVKVVQLLLKWGADPNTRGGQYRCALQAAAFKGKERVVRILVAVNARIEWPDDEESDYEDAIAAAEAGQHPRVARWLKEWKNGTATIEFQSELMTLGTRTVTRRAKTYDSDDTGNSSADDD